MKKTCSGCGNTFETKYKHSKFCSEKCRYTPCIICNKPIRNLTRRRKTCSKKCQGFLFKETFKGENNPNYGNNWSDEQKAQQSLIMKSKVTDDFRFKVGSANRGKKFSKDRIKRMHENRTFESYSHPHSDKIKKIIGIKSKEKFTDEYKKKHRKKMEKIGAWISIEDKSDYNIYHKESNWNNPIFPILYEDNKNIIKKHGIFNAYTNTRGVVRDHAFSRNSGFALGVFPEILRHIENCQIILHSDNVKKHISAKIPSDSLTLEKLFDKIEKTKYTDWAEQDICLQRIKEYRNGKRWKRKEAKCVSETK